MSSYYENLVNAGVKDYSVEDFHNDYRIGLLISQSIMCVAAADTDIRLFAKECTDLGVDWKEALVGRTQAAMAQWEVLPYLRSIVGE